MFKNSKNFIPLKDNKLLLASLICLTFFGISLKVFATPPATKYSPGETLDPSCPPGDPNCSVDIGSGWGLSGNSGTTPGTNFIGTTDMQDLIIKVNNSQVGKITSPNQGNSIYLGLNTGDIAIFNAVFIGENAGYSASAATNSNFIGLNAGYNATAAIESNFIGHDAGKGASGAQSSNFIGKEAGLNASNATGSIFIGDSAGSLATDAYSSNFFGQGAGFGAIAASESNFIGVSAGDTAENAYDSNFIGYHAGLSATNSSNSNFFGYQAGSNAINAANSIFIGQSSGANDTVDNSNGVNYSILIGPATNTGGFSNSIALGDSAVNTATNQLLIGGNSSLGGINNVYIGKGVVSASPVGFSLNATGGSGTDIAGGSITIAGGKATGSATGGSILFQTSDAGATGTTLQSLTTKMSLLANGKLGIGVTPAYRFDVLDDNASTYVANFFNDGNNDNRYGISIQAGADTPSANKWIQFNDGDGTDQGSICYTGGQANICAPSDVRLKNNIVDTSISLDTLLQIKVRDFAYNSDSNSRTVHGFIAQELYDIYPDAVSKAVNPNDYWKVSYNQLTPLIVKSIQELNFKIVPLESLDLNTSNTLGSLIKSFLANSANTIENIFTNRITTKEICIDDNTCLNENDIRNLVNQAHQQQNSNQTPPDGTTDNTQTGDNTTPVDDSTTDPEITPPSDPAPDLVPPSDPTPDPAPSPDPAPAPDPSPAI